MEIKKRTINIKNPNTGEWEQIPALRGEKGEKGERGLQGPKGDPGATGPQGPQGDKGDNKVGYATCSTSADVAEKIVTVDDPNWKLEVGSLIMVRFSVANTASNVTLNVNNTGAYGIRTTGESAYTGTSTTYTGAVNRGLTYIFDGSYWQWISSGAYPSSATNVSLGQGYASCSTSASTKAKTASLSSYTLSTGGIVAVRFTNAVPAGATLNINSKGAKAIYYKNTAITDGVIKAGDIATFIYSTYYRLISIDRAGEPVDLSNYVTKDEVSNLATKDEVSNLATKGEVDSTMESLTLGVHTDGKIYLFKNGSPQGNGLIVTAQETPVGDVVGYVDEDNNIVLSGLLKDNTYLIKYEMEDGTIVDIGDLIIGVITPSTPTEVNILDEYEIEYNYRWSGSSNALSANNGMICIAVPMADVLNREIRLEGFESGLQANGKGASWYIYDGGTKVGTCKSTDGTGIVWANPMLKTDSDGVCSIAINGSTFDNVNGTTLYISLAIRDGVAVSEADLAGKALIIKGIGEDLDVTNLLPTAIDENGNDFVGVALQGGDGFEYGYRISSSYAITSATGVYVTGFIPLSSHKDYIYVKNITQHATDSNNRFVFYNSKFEPIGTSYLLSNSNGLTYSNGVYCFTPNAFTLTSYDDVAYVRFCCGSITYETIVTVNQPIE